jgi:hypothetical protein
VKVIMRETLLLFFSWHFLTRYWHNGKIAASGLRNFCKAKRKEGGAQEPSPRY